jgi:tetratricopeptide (TPR) repeat protein
MIFDRYPRVGAGVLVLVLTLTLPLLGHAQPVRKGNEFQTYLNAAARLYENLEYEEALEKLERAKKYVRDVEDDVTLSFYEGIILADMGRREQSHAAFRAGLLLRPEAKLPVKVSPKVEREFETLRTDVRRELEALRATQEAQKPPVAQKDPAPPLPATPTPANSGTSPPPALTPSVTAETPAPRSKVLPYSLMSGGAVLAGAGVALGLSALSFNDRKRELTANEAILERDKASTQLTLGTVLVGGGLAAIGTGVALLLIPRSPSGQSSSTPRATLQLTPLPGGFALGTTGHF